MIENRNVNKVFYLFFIIFLSFILFKKYLSYSKQGNIFLLENIKFHNGDIVLRKEFNRISDIFATINGTKYSHIGTVLFIDGNLKVIHIEDNGEENDYKFTSLPKFLKFASNYAIYRPKKRVDRQKLYSKVMAIKKENPNFDMSFRVNNKDNKLYCTELAYLLNKNSTMFDIQPELKSYVHYKFISIKSFTDKRYFTLIYENL